MKLTVSLILILISLPLIAETTTYRVLIGGDDTGHLVVDQRANQIAIDFDFKQNGRGPTIAEEITIDGRGYPTDWTLTGKTTFGNSVDEYFRVEDGIARWQDTTGTGEARVDNELLFYVDQNSEFFAVAGPRFSIVREGYEAADESLRHYAEKLSTERFVEIQSNVAHEYNAPVRIRNVRIFDPEALELTDLKDVVIYGNRIAAVQAAQSPSTDREVVIDGAGGTLVPGMYEMHGHIGQGNALLNIAAGVTSVRDMGNENAVLESLTGRIDNGEIAGPRITRSCFIEGKSDFSAATGEIVASLEEGLDMVRWCGARGFYQVKLYNSMRPEWAQTLVDEAHQLGMQVAGHVPAFSSANEMIEAGFDEITHVNQLMLGWVLNEGEDTRTLFRFTAMKRFPALNLDGEDVQFTIGRMLQNDVAHDPTIAIHEHGMTAVDRRRRRGSAAAVQSS